MTNWKNINNSKNKYWFEHVEKMKKLIQFQNKKFEILYRFNVFIWFVFREKDKNNTNEKIFYEKYLMLFCCNCDET